MPMYCTAPASFLAAQPVRDPDFGMADHPHDGLERPDRTIVSAITSETVVNVCRLSVLNPRP